MESGNEKANPEAEEGQHSISTAAAGTASSAVIERQVQKRIFKIIVIGDSNVGKTCLTFRFCGGRFPEKTEATIGVDFREKTVEINGELVKLQLWDTAGQERFRKSMVQHYYRNVHAVVFVYDVTKVSSFENLPQWIAECDQHHLTNEVPRILVGNKCDMKDKIAVSTNMAQKFADLHAMPLFETSAKDSHKADHVDAIFMTIAHKLMNAKPMMLPFNYGDMSYSTETGKVVSVGAGPRTESVSSADSKDSSCACSTL